MRVLATPPPPRVERPASAVLHDEDDLRVVAFTLQPGQAVPAHSSTSTVTLHVLAGDGRFLGAGNAAATLVPGQTAVYAPGESHAIFAGPDGVRFLAFIAPRPR